MAKNYKGEILVGATVTDRPNNPRQNSYPGQDNLFGEEVSEAIGKDVVEELEERVRSGEEKSLEVLYDYLESSTRKGREDFGKFQSNGEFVIGRNYRRIIAEHLPASFPFQRFLKERIELIMSLYDAGYFADVLVVPEDCRFSTFNEKINHLDVETEEFSARNLRGKVSWPRDLGIDFDGELFINSEWKEFFWERLGITDYSHSEIGEGGRIVYDDNMALISESVSEETVKMLESSHEVYRIPNAAESVPVRRMSESYNPPILVETYHIDIAVNLVSERADKEIMVVDPDYLKEHEDVIYDIAREEGYEVLQVEDEEKHLLPANFAKLPGGELLTNKAPGLVKSLEERGAEVIYPYIPLEATPEHSGGGVRCATNVVDVDSSQYG